MPNRSGADLKKRSDELKRSLRKPPAKGRVILERGAKHTKVLHRDTRKVITTIPDTPSDWRGVKNTIAALKREKVFGDSAKSVGIPGSYETPSMDLVHDGLRVLKALGWEHGQRGRGGGALRAFGKIIQDAAIKMGDVEVHPNPDHYAKIASATIIYGKNVTHENLDILEAAIDYAFGTLTIPPDSGNGSLAAAVEAEVVAYTKEVEREVVSAHDVSELPPVEYADVGPLFTEKGKDIEGALFVQILAAILDPNTTREEAIELSILVSKLEGF